MMVFISNVKLHVSAYSGHLQVLTIFLLKEFYIIRHRKPNVSSLRTPTHNKTLEADQPPAENRKSEE